MAKKAAPLLLDVLTAKGDIIYKAQHNKKLDGHGHKVIESVLRDTTGRNQGARGKVAFIAAPCVNEACPGLVYVKEEALASAVDRMVGL
jgi:hypothetical protein